MEGDLNESDLSQLVFNDAPRIIWIPVQQALALLWDENPKEHDLGALIQSIQKYGFQELPKYDATLGGIKSGNGRTYALAIMEQNQKRDNYSLPRGIAQDKTSGLWIIPVLVGTDAESIELAKAYAIDANNLTMAGGDFTGFDYLKMWDSQKYIAVLDGLPSESLPITVSQELLELLHNPGEYNLPLDSSDQPEPDMINVIRITVRNASDLGFLSASIKNLLAETGIDADVQVK